MQPIGASATNEIPPAIAAVRYSGSMCRKTCIRNIIRNGHAGRGLRRAYQRRRGGICPQLIREILRQLLQPFPRHHGRRAELSQRGEGGFGVIAPEFLMGGDQLREVGAHIAAQLLPGLERHDADHRRNDVVQVILDDFAGQFILYFARQNLRLCEVKLAPAKRCRVLVVLLCQGVVFLHPGLPPGHGR